MVMREILDAFTKRSIYKQKDNFLKGTDHILKAKDGSIRHVLDFT